MNGSSGQGVADIPITAVALPRIPVWLGWTIGLVPFYVLCVFFLMQLVHDKKLEQTGTEQTHVPQIKDDTLTV